MVLATGVYDITSQTKPWPLTVLLCGPLSVRVCGRRCEKDGMCPMQRPDPSSTSGDKQGPMCFCVPCPKPRTLRRVRHEKHTQKMACMSKGGLGRRGRGGTSLSKPVKLASRPV
jgi:hypothetical protein